MRLLAIADLHVGHPVNRQAIQDMPAHPDDWLILAGDVGETEAHLEMAFRTLAPRFARLIWVPGNHEMWTSSLEPEALRGQARYERLVSLCRSYGVQTPEDPYPVWPGEGAPLVIAPTFLLYDYSFRPDNIEEGHALEWAIEDGVLCVDEQYLHPDPFVSRQAWCAERCRLTEERLARIPRGHEIAVVNHYPLRRDLVRIPRIPRFSIWCGTRRTEDWQVRFPLRIAVSGHLHVRSTDWRDGVRFEEVSLGYPRQWRQERGVGAYLREILAR